MLVKIFMSTQKSTKTARKRNKKNKQVVRNTAQQKKMVKPAKTFQTSSQAASYDVVVENPTNFEIKGQGQRHSEYGEGLRVVGRQQLVLVTTTASNSQLFVSGIGTANTINAVLISPVSLNDRVALLSSMYQRYSFRRIRFTYITRVGTTQVGSFCMAYTSDSAYANVSSTVAPTYSTLQDLKPGKIIPFRKEITSFDMSYTGERTWMCAFDTNADAVSEAIRQCYQGALIGYPDVTSIGAIPMGEIYIDYDLDLYAPTFINTNVTLMYGIDSRVRSFVSALLVFAKKLSKESCESLVPQMKDLLGLFIHKQVHQKDTSVNTNVVSNGF
jgi:hypothetical protein